MPGIGVFPGTFNPVTIGHVAIAEAAWRQHRLERIDVVVNDQPLAKTNHPELAPLHQRIEWLQHSLEPFGWATVRITTDVLVADIAAGYDIVILGADKWLQVNDPVFYGGDPAARDAAVARLPTLTIAPRDGIDIPGHLKLGVPAWVAEVSATAVRQGRVDWHAAPPTA